MTLKMKRRHLNPLSITTLLTTSIIIIVTLGLILSTHSKTIPTDIEILRTLKSGIDPNTIPTSSYIASWDFKLDPCESTGAHFLGILCTIPTDGNSSTRITAIDLDGVGYDGFLAKEIGQLTELTILNVGNNKFRGPIPDSIIHLDKLITLDLSQNFFTGSMLPGVGNFKRLQTINLSHNKLTGPIPPWVSNYRNLVTLRISNNAFSGRLPNLAGLWQLTTLDVSNNELYGSLPQLPINLRTLILNHNILSGHLSPVARLVRLRSLDLSENRFTGTITSAIMTLPEVRTINVSINWLNQIEVPKFSGATTHLQELDVHENHIRGRLPANLVTIGTLTNVDLSHNQFSGPIPTDFGLKAATSWKTLFLDHNFLVGALPPELSSTRDVRGSVAHNCLRCPKNVSLCRGGQRTAGECIGQDGSGDSLSLQDEQSSTLGIPFLS